VLPQPVQLPCCGKTDLAVNQAIKITNIVALLLPAMLMDAVVNSRTNDMHSAIEGPHLSNLEQ
jgi:hypothetical protein